MNGKHIELAPLTPCSSHVIVGGAIDLWLKRTGHANVILTVTHLKNQQPDEDDVERLVYKLMSQPRNSTGAYTSEGLTLNVYLK